MSDILTILTCNMYRKVLPPLESNPIVIRLSAPLISTFTGVWALAPLKLNPHGHGIGAAPLKLNPDGRVMGAICPPEIVIRGITTGLH